jgi:hypothetical protein
MQYFEHSNLLILWYHLLMIRTATPNIEWSDMLVKYCYWYLIDDRISVCVVYLSFHMIILILSIYHLYHPWYFTTIYDKTVGNAWLSLENIFTTHSQTTFMFRKPWRNQNSNQYYNLITFARAGLVCSKHLSRKTSHEPQALGYSIHWEMYTPYAYGATFKLTILNRKCDIIISVMRSSSWLG